MRVAARPESVARVGAPGPALSGAVPLSAPSRAPSAGARVAALAPLVLAAALGALVMLLVARAPNVSGDSETLLQGSQTAQRCLAEGRFTRCGVGVPILSPTEIVSGVAPFPLLQYLVTVPLFALGATKPQVDTALALVSVAAFLATLALVALSARAVAGRWAAALGALVVAAGPLLYYANSTFGEMTAAALTAAVVAAVLLRVPPWLLALAVLLAGVSKETAPPFLVAMGLIAVLAVDRRPLGALRPQLVALGAGALGAVAANALFNVFRYGSPLNESYLLDEYTTSALGDRAVHFAALFVAPNGGLVPFWPLAALLVLAVPAVVAVRRGPPRPRLLALAVLAVVGALHVGLASWWAPFGWWAWGPRLTAPWVPALVLLSIALAAEPLRRVAGRLLTRRWAAVLVAVAVSLAALPHAAVALDAAVPIRLFGEQTDLGICTGKPEAREPCLRHLAFERPSILREAAGTLRSPVGGLTVLLLAGSVAALVAVARVSAGGSAPASAAPAARPSP